MRLAYVYPEELPSKKARAVSVLNTACNLSKYIDFTLIYEKSGMLDCDINTIQIKKKFFLRSNKIFHLNLTKYIDQFDYFYVRHLKTAEFLIKKKKKVVYEVHEIFSEQNYKVKDLEKYVLKNATGLVFINEFLANYTKKKFNVTQNLKIIRNGCDFKFGYVHKDFSDIDAIYYIGSFQRWKGVEFLIEAINKTNYKLCIVGDGPQKKELQKKAKKNIEFKGYMEYNEIKNLLRRVKLAVIPNIKSISTKFSTPIKLYEYMRASCIVLAPDIPTIREIVKDGENGFLFEIENQKSFLEKLNYILSLDKEKLKQISKNAYESVKYFTWDNRAKQIVSFIKELDEKNNISSS